MQNHTHEQIATDIQKVMEEAERIKMPNPQQLVFQKLSHKYPAKEIEKALLRQLENPTSEQLDLETLGHIASPILKKHSKKIIPIIIGTYILLNILFELFANFASS